MTMFRSRSAEFLPHRPVSTTTRQLQEVLYTLLDDHEKSAFIEALSLYRAHRDIFDLVNSLRKILNTPVKRQLFPLVRKVIRRSDVDAFDLVTRGIPQSNNVTLPYLYSPHVADLNVLNKYRESTISVSHRGTLNRSWEESPAVSSGNVSGYNLDSSERTQKTGRAASGRDVKHKALSERSSKLKHELEGEVFQIDIGEPDPGGGYGFSIRGGVDVGVGVYVSIVDNDSSAQRQGLTAGDCILEANNISFEKISHEDAARMITAATRLQVTVSRVGRIPGKRTVHESYRWTDPKGRPVSPPSSFGSSALGEGDGRGRSASQMLKGSDERKINIVMQKGHGLGVMIRGGKEYGLGIFVSGIDSFSLAENAGMKLGDHILDVNGRSFLDVTHSEAVSYLKSSRHLIITVKDVGKIPFAKTTIDAKSWIESTKVGSYPNSLSVSSRKSPSGSATDQEGRQKISATVHELRSTGDGLNKSFLRGVGTQLMLSSSLGRAKQREQIHNQAKLLLNETEHATLNYYLAEYEKRSIDIRGLVQALLELLNTPAKFTILSEIRSTVLPSHLDIFDLLVAKRDLDKSLNQARQMLAPDVLSLNSYDSSEIIGQNKNKRTLFSQQKNISLNQQWMQALTYDDYSDTKDMGNGVLGVSRQMSKSTPDLSYYSDSNQDKRQSRYKSRSKSPRSMYQVTSSKDVPRSRGQRLQVMNRDRWSNKGKKDDPSDDSGVETNGYAQKDMTTRSHHGPHDQTFMHTPMSPIIIQESITSELSDPQKRILYHLQQRNNTVVGHSNTTNNSENINTETRQHYLKFSRETSPSKSIFNENKGMYSIVDRSSEIAKPRVNFQQENIDDISDIVALEHAPDSPSDNARVTHSHNTSSSKKHQIQRSDRSRSRSKSKYKNPFDSHVSNESVDNLTHNFDVEKDHSFSEKDGSNQREQNNSKISSKQAQSMMSTHATKPRSRKDKSPFRRMVDSWRRTSTAETSTKPEVTLTVNGQLMSPAQTTNGQIHQHIVSQPTSVQTWSSQHNKHNEEHKNYPIHQNRSINFESDADQTLETSRNMSDNGITISRMVSQTETTNKQSKRALFTNAKKGKSRENSPTKVVGGTSTRYKSPRRDKQISKINVSLIRKHHNMLENAESQSPTQGLNTDNNYDDKHMKSYRSDNQHGDVVHKDEQFHTKLTISDQLLDSDTSYHNGNTRNDNNSIGSVTGSKITSIYVVGRPGLDVSSSPVDVIKKKAAEKYGEIPLDVVYIYRSKPTLGVAIEGGANTRQPLPKVISVQPGGSAFESGGLKVGHIILEVNGQPAVGLSHMDAARLIAEAFKNTNYNRMELLVTEWSDRLLDTIKVDVGLLRVK